MSPELRALVLAGARVFDGLRHLGGVGDVLVRDGRIASVGTSTPCRAGSSGSPAT